MVMILKIGKILDKVIMVYLGEKHTHIMLKSILSQLHSESKILENYHF